MYVPRQTLQQLYQNAFGDIADHDAGLSVRTHPRDLQAHQHACGLICWSVCVYVPGEDLQQLSQKAYNEEIHAEPGLSVCKYLGKLCSSFTRKHTRMMPMMILICLCVPPQTDPSGKM